LIKCIYTQIPGIKTISELKDVHQLNKCLSHLVGSSVLSKYRYECSQPVIGIVKKIKDKSIVSAKMNGSHIDFEKKESLNASFDKNFETLDKIYFKNEPELNKLNNNIKHTVSGPSSLKEHGDPKIISSIKPEDDFFLENSDNNNAVMLPIYISNPDNQIIIDSSENLENPDNYVRNQFDLAKNFIRYYGKPI
jgi:hypothetical protein